MSVEGLLGSEEEKTARRLLEQASQTLAKRQSSIPESFVTQFYGRAVSDDLMAYAPATLARLANEAWAFLAARRPGAPKIRLETTQDAGPDGGLKPASVIEIISDDMPFLVDSVMGELTERGIEVRLVVHPVFTVERDADGRMTAFLGD